MVSKSEGMEAVAWVLQEVGEDAIPEPSLTMDAHHAQHLDRSGRFAVDPLVRLSDAQAAVERARKEGRRESEIRGEVEG